MRETDRLSEILLADGVVTKESITASGRKSDKPFQAKVVTLADGSEYRIDSKNQGGFDTSPFGDIAATNIFFTLTNLKNKKSVELSALSPLLFRHGFYANPVWMLIGEGSRDELVGPKKLFSVLFEK